MTKTLNFESSTLSTKFHQNSYIQLPILTLSVSVSNFYHEILQEEKRKKQHKKRGNKGLRVKRQAAYAQLMAEQSVPASASSF